jgi:exopolysaccharide biosynthesis polyprenyl glycosylphosphotransferase
MASTVGTKELRSRTSVLAVEQATFIPDGPQMGLAAVAKRAIDIVGALVVLTVLAPLFIVIAIAIVLESGWPVIFAQKRLGQGGREFTVYKFRSMARDAEARLAEVREHNDVPDGPIFKWKEDPRITKVGRFLRRTSLDELPQLWNVLLGNMSLVGPRPPLLSEVLEYEAWQLGRLAVKPGMTGLWQVSGRSNLTFTEMVELDIAYVESWSIKRDIVLLLKTPLAVLTARGAY